jgi:hypothetical protein
LSDGASELVKNPGHPEILILDNVYVQRIMKSRISGNKYGYNRIPREGLIKVRAG